MRLRWRDIGCCTALVWLAACRAAPEASRSRAAEAPAARPAVAKPAARPAPASPVTTTRSPAATQRAAPAPRPGRILTSSTREVSLDPSTLDAALGAMPETRELAATFRPFSEQALGRAWTAQRAQQGAGLQTARAALLWSPPRGEQVVVVSGDTPQGAVLLAYAPRASGGPRFAASYQTRGEHAPILLGARAGAAEELLFSTCWACGGEGGALRLDAGGRPRLVLR